MSDFLLLKLSTNSTRAVYSSPLHHPCCLQLSSTLPTLFTALPHNTHAVYSSSPHYSCCLQLSPTTPMLFTALPHSTHAVYSSSPQHPCCLQLFPTTPMLFTALPHITHAVYSSPPQHPCSFNYFERFCSTTVCLTLSSNFYYANIVCLYWYCITTLSITLTVWEFNTGSVLLQLPSQ